MAEAGRRLADALLAGDDQRLLAGVLDRLTPDDSAAVVLSAAGDGLSLPVELIRLDAGDGPEAGPLGLLPAVSVSRRLAPDGRDLTAPPVMPAAAPGRPGPLKVLAAVAAPDETRTSNAPLDTEAEMAAVLDAVAGVVADDAAVQVRILEVASLPAIRQALADDDYHVLHLSAHGSPASIELEDEDGAPAEVTTQALMQALRHAGRAVPLIMLSSCSGGAAGSQAMAAGLAGQGADRVIAMLAPVTDSYATTLARHFYRELSKRPGLSAGQALARARYRAEEDRAAAAPHQRTAPEYGVPTLLAAGADGPLVDPVAAPEPLTLVTTPPGGAQVRELPMGALIGRRAQIRDRHGRAAPRPGCGGTVRGGQRGGLHRRRWHRENRAGRTGDVPAP